MDAETGTGASISEKLMGIIRKNMETEKEVTLSSSLRDELELDSFGTMMIVDAVEEAFGITVEDSDFQKLVTVADIVRVLEEKGIR